MTVAYDLNKLIRTIAEDALAGAQQAFADGVVESVEGQYAAVRLGANNTPTPGFYFPPSLVVQAGDHVLLARPKGYQLVLAVLQRNALAAPPAATTADHNHSSSGAGGALLLPRAIGLVSGALNETLDDDTDDWTPSGLTAASLIRVTPAADLLELSGIAAVGGGRTFPLINAAATNRLVLLHEDTGSVAANRFRCPDATDFTLAPFQAVQLVYDDEAQRWVLEAPAPATGGGIEAGTSFPGSPSTNDRFFRTDRGIEYYYDGTRWLSVQEYVATQEQTGGFSGNTTHDLGMAYPEVYDKWLVRADLAFQVVSGGTALSGSHKWDVTIVKSGTGGAEQTIGSGVVFTIDSGASNTWRVATPVTIGELLGSYNVFRVQLVKTGTPGNLRPTPSVVYRLVG